MRKNDPWKKVVLDINNKVHKHRLLTILFAAFFTTAALTALVNLNESMGEPRKRITVTEQKGIYDLTQIDNLEDTVIKLVPGAFYYPSTYLIPEQIDTTLPVSTDRFEELGRTTFHSDLY